MRLFISLPEELIEGLVEKLWAACCSLRVQGSSRLIKASVSLGTRIIMKVKRVGGFPTVVLLNKYLKKIREDHHHP